MDYCKEIRIAVISTNYVELCFREPTQKQEHDEWLFNHCMQNYDALSAAVKSGNVNAVKELLSNLNTDDKENLLTYRDPVRERLLI